MRPTLSLLLQRAWHTCEPALAAVVNLIPDALKTIIFRILAKQLHVSSIEVDGEVGLFHGDPQDLAVVGENMRFGTYSPEFIEFIVGWFADKGAGTFIDIGANIGLISVPIARSGVDCICFEPDPRNFNSLIRNGAEYLQNGRMKAYNLALYDCNSEIEFEISDWNYGDHRIRSGQNNLTDAFGERHRKIIPVTASRLDDAVDDTSVRSPIVVKIDTQGAEVNILRGGSNVISKADLLSLEFCPYLIRRFGENEDELIDLVASNFSRRAISNWHDRNRQPLQIRPIAEVAKELRHFSRTIKTTKHLDLLLVDKACER
jgi:FkbM family methyltransferase